MTVLRRERNSVFGEGPRDARLSVAEIKAMGLGAAYSSKKKQTDDIPMAAMPDIAFLLLMFFMVSTTFLVARSVDVELPAYSKERPKEQKQYITLFLAADSLQMDYRGEKEKLELWELEGRVSAALAYVDDDSARVVVFDVDDDCPLQRLIDAFDAVRRAEGYVTLVEPEAEKDRQGS